MNLTNIRATLCGLIKRTSHFRRTPATHVFVLMVSSETCDKKPYALPVQCIPYSGLKESDLPSKLKLQRYVEALNDLSSGLTYPAFIGSRK